MVQVWSLCFQGYCLIFNLPCKVGEPQSHVPVNLVS